MSAYPTTPCKGPTCGKPIMYGELEDGRRVPLDPRPPVYRVIGQKSDGTLMIRRDDAALVSHFTTCPDAGKFSGSKKKEVPA